MEHLGTVQVLHQHVGEVTDNGYRKLYLYDTSTFPNGPNHTQCGHF